MKKVELLAPAGDFEALRAAVMSGADAVYLGGNRFGARAFAHNFDDDEMIKAINYAHLYGAKIYVTMNTIIYENEISDFIDYITFLYKNGVDAIILQDFGMLHLIRNILPELEIHASTQMHIHNEEGVMRLKKLGVKRVVLARETPIEMVRQIKANTGMDIEIFVHGALCISYSGQCLMSSLIGGRSGNRGECAGCCRLPYKLVCKDGNNETIIKTDGSYLLSTKDLNTLEYLPEIIESGVDSLKIEGRMKRAEYVALVVSMYRKAIDAYYNGENFEVRESDITELKKIFNRGFTKGHLFNDKNEDLMNPIRPNHMGIPLGKVIAANDKYISIKLEHPLKQGDGIRILSDNDEGFIVNFIYQKSKLINHADVNEIVEIDAKAKVNVGALVIKTTDIHQLQALQDMYQNGNRTVKIKGILKVKVNEPLFLEVSDGINKVNVISEVKIEESIKRSTSMEDLLKQLHKTGNTPYQFTNIDIIMNDKIFVPISIINDLRRDALEKLSEMRISIQHDVIIKQYDENISNEYINNTIIKALVKTEEQYRACVNSKITYIYIDNDELYEKYKMNDNVHKVYDRVIEKNIGVIENSLVGELGSVVNNVVTDFSLNVVNSYAVAYLSKLGAKTITLSYEMNLNQIKDLINGYQEKYHNKPNIEVIIYGRQEVMINNYCLLNMYVYNDKTGKCNICKNNKNYYLRDRFHNDYLIKNKNCLMHIFNYNKLNLLDQVNEMYDFGIRNYRLNFVDEDYNECLTVLHKVINKLK